MSEYDYSPGALERYKAQQAKVGRWAADTSSQASHYSHPFPGYTGTTVSSHRPKVPSRSSTLPTHGVPDVLTRFHIPGRMFQAAIPALAILAPPPTYRVHQAYPHALLPTYLGTGVPSVAPSDSISQAGSRSSKRSSTLPSHAGSGHRSVVSSGGNTYLYGPPDKTTTRPFTANGHLVIPAPGQKLDIYYV
ncbi:hypothetical protein DL96DRAFT_1679640 [Flagelloscypha sp. PMI_526]|nr:hypothetical protein DL96DRAFT_1679640 [Flagelloscypha sp. PMI_526]